MRGIEFVVLVLVQENVDCCDDVNRDRDDGDATTTDGDAYCDGHDVNGGFDAMLDAAVDYC